MAKTRIDNERGSIEVEITDIALVVAVLGLAAAGLAAGWFATRNPQILRILVGTAKEQGVRLLHRGSPLLRTGGVA